MPSPLPLPVVAPRPATPVPAENADAWRPLPIALLPVSRSPLPDRVVFPVPRAQHELMVVWQSVYDRIVGAMGDGPLVHEALRRALPAPFPVAVVTRMFDPFNHRYVTLDPLSTRDPVLADAIERVLTFRARLYLDEPLLRPLLDRIGPEGGQDRLDAHRRRAEREVLQAMVRDHEATDPAPTAFTDRDGRAMRTRL